MARASRSTTTARTPVPRPACLPERSTRGSGPVLRNVLYWCVDILKHVSLPAVLLHGYTAAAFESAPLTYDATRQLNLVRLFTNNIGAALSDAQHSAAFQIAIWDVLFDNDANISTYGGAGQFGLSAGNAATILIAQGYVNQSWRRQSPVPAHPIDQQGTPGLRHARNARTGSRALPASASGCRARCDAVRNAASQGRPRPQLRQQDGGSDGAQAPPGPASGQCSFLRLPRLRAWFLFCAVGHGNPCSRRCRRREDATRALRLFRHRLP